MAQHNFPYTFYDHHSNMLVMKASIKSLVRSETEYNKIARAVREYNDNSRRQELLFKFIAPYTIEMPETGTLYMMAAINAVVKSESKVNEIGAAVREYNDILWQQKSILKFISFGKHTEIFDKSKSKEQVVFKLPKNKHVEPNEKNEETVEDGNDVNKCLFYVFVLVLLIFAMMCVYFAIKNNSQQHGQLHLNYDVQPVFSRD